MEVGQLLIRLGLLAFDEADPERPPLLDQMLVIVRDPEVRRFVRIADVLDRYGSEGPDAPQVRAALGALRSIGDSDPLERPLASTDLHPRIVAALAEIDVHTVGDAAALAPGRLLGLPNMGPQCLGELQLVVRRYVDRLRHVESCRDARRKQQRAAAR